MKAKSWYQHQVSSFSIAIQLSRNCWERYTTWKPDVTFNRRETGASAHATFWHRTPTDLREATRRDTTRYDATPQRRCYLPTVIMGKLWASRLSASPYIFRTVLIAQAQRAAVFSIRNLTKPYQQQRFTASKDKFKSPMANEREM